MSNVKAGEKPARRKPKDSCSTLSEQGESAPKVRPKGVADGNQVNIPEPASDAMGGRSMEDHPGVGSPGCLA